MSIYLNNDYLIKSENLRIFVDKENYLFSIIVIIWAIDLSFQNKTLTFVSTNIHGTDKAIALVNVIGSDY